MKQYEKDEWREHMAEYGGDSSPGGKGKDDWFEKSDRREKSTIDIDNAQRQELQNIDNYYPYDILNKPYEPLVQPFSYFYLALQGQIENGFFMDLDGLSIKYAIVVGDEWDLASGVSKG